MSATARLSGWLKKSAAHEPVAPAGDVRALVKRQLFEDIGDFLRIHDLEVSDRNFAVARAYFTGDPAVAPQIEALLREHGRLSDAMLAAIGAPREGALSAELVDAAAAQLSTQLGKCLAIVGDSRVLSEDYEASLAIETISVVSDPVGAFERIMRLTRQLVDATRTMEGRLDTARRETGRLRASLERARREADRDHLTGLPNRRHFEARLNALAVDGGGCVALCDVDDFKEINDRHGHTTGDRVLRFIGSFLDRTLGKDVVVARYGGEEFVCLFKTQTVEQAMALLEGARLGLLARELVNKDTDEPIGRLTFSAGVAALGTTPHDAVGRADEALYAAKRAGKNRLVAAGATIHLVPAIEE